MCTADSGMVVETDGLQPATGWASAAKSRLRPILHAVSLGSPTGTASEGQIFVPSSDPSAHSQ